MAKKTVVQKPAVAAPIASKPKGSMFRWTAADIFPVFFCLAYFMLHFIDDWGAYDAMGAQWIYICIIDFAVILFLLIKKDQFKDAAAGIFGNLFSKLYLAFFVFAGISIFFAINPTESIVCYVRLIATIIAFFNIAILLYGRTDLFKILARILSLILLVDVLSSLGHFINGVNESTPLGELVFSLKGNDGNKNIYAAGLMTKVPFVLYGIHTSKLAGKIYNIIIFFLTATLIFIISARSTFLSLLLLIFLYSLHAIFLHKKERKLDNTLIRISRVIVPALIAYFVGLMYLENVRNAQAAERGTEGLEFGSVTERLVSVGKTEDESNQVRIRLWAHAIDYTKHHPVMGCGIGNWKIASIPYQRTITNDLFVPVHAHNDYLEMFAELGIAGGLLYLSLFVTIFLFTWRTFFSDASEQTKLVSVFSFMAFVTYMMDAMFNFPIERPITQMFFAFLSAVNIGAYIKGLKEQDKEKPASAGSSNYKFIFAFVSMLLLLPCFYVTYQTYKSLILQRTVLGDLNNEPLKLDWKVITRDFPPIPNLSATAQPIESIKGRYLYEAGMWDQALVLLNKGAKANPVIGYSEFLKAGLYYKMAQTDTTKNPKRWYDSARRNALYAFWIRPKAKTYFQTLIAVLSAMKDTANIESSFREYDKYRHHQFGWNLYLLGLIRAEAALGRMPPRMFTLVDSALQMFGQNDPELLLRKKEISDNYSLFSRVTATGGSVEKVNESLRQYSAGVAAFGAGQLEKAAQAFLKSVELNPEYMAALENAAICYFNLRNYPKAIALFDRELAMNRSVDGKPEYYKAISLINTGKAEEGCKWMRVAAQKKHVPPDHDPSKLPEAIIKANCGGK